MRHTNFSLRCRVIDDAAVVSPEGYLNSLAGESLVSECNSYVGKGITRIVINFGRIEFINSIGISLLLSLIDKLKNCKGTLCFSDVRTHHRETFEMLGLAPHMLFFPREEDALAFLNGAKQK